METKGLMKTPGSEAVIGDLASTQDAEWDAQPLRPVAHWVLMPTAQGRNQLSMVWETPDPLPPSPR